MGVIEQPKSQVRCGIYAIQESESGRLYIGSSVRIHQRWSEHRRYLRKGTHHSSLLQQAWTLLGPQAFKFIVLEECGRLELQQREQEYIDFFRPQFNVEPVVTARSEALYALLAERGRQRSVAVTHCPQGHEYTVENTYHDRNGRRICRACTALRVSSLYTQETPEQRETRRRRVKTYYETNKSRLSAQMREYAASRKEEKRAYDAARKEVANAQRRARHANETPEQRSIRLALRRERERDTWAESNRRRRDRLKETV